MDLPLTDSDNDRNEHRRRLKKKPARSSAESAVRQMRKRLNMLRDYQADTLSHRAGDVELAVETVIFEQLVRQSKASRQSTSSSSDSMLHSVLENVQGAISQLAGYRESDRQEHQRLMEQHARLVTLTESLAASKAEPSATTPTAVPGVVSQAEYELTISQLEALRAERDKSVATIATIQGDYSQSLATLAAVQTEHNQSLAQLAAIQNQHNQSLLSLTALQNDYSASTQELALLKTQHADLLASIQSNQSEQSLAADRLSKLTLAYDELQTAANSKQLEYTKVSSELQELKLQHRALLASSDAAHSEHKHLNDQLNRLRNEHDNLIAAGEAKNTKYETVLKQLSDLEIEHEKLLALVEAHKSEQLQLTSQVETLRQARDQLQSTEKQQQDQLARLALQVNELNLKHERLVHSTSAESSSADNAAQLQSLQSNFQTLEQQLSLRTSELIETQLLLEDYKSKAETATADHTKTQEFLVSLREQLVQERQSVVELRMQVDDLKATIAETSDVPTGVPKQLTWDQQKALLLKKLEGESQLGNIDLEKSLEIKDVVERANQEVGKRDCEIMELKRLLAEQSTASASVAIGAAAVAEMLDHDDFIREERENLRVLQEQLQAKLREAEVEISLERAKLARQRSELEDRAKDSERAIAQSEESKNSTVGSRWRSRLGLGEQEKL